MEINELNEKLRPFVEGDINLFELDRKALEELVEKTIAKYCGPSLETQRKFLIKRGWDLDYKEYSVDTLVAIYTYFETHGEFINDLVNYQKGRK